MSEPITIDGHSKKITITLPSSYRITGSAGSTIIEIDSDPKAPFKSLDVRKMDEPRKLQVKYKAPDYKSRWKVTIR